MIDEYQRRYGGNTLHPSLLAESVNTNFVFVSVYGPHAAWYVTEITRATARWSLKTAWYGNSSAPKFWAENPKHYNDVVFQPDPLPDDIEHGMLSPEEKRSAVVLRTAGKAAVYRPLLDAGHSGAYYPSPNIACLDYSAVKYGRLAAYRMDQETSLQMGKFTWVRVEKTER